MQRRWVILGLALTALLGFAHFAYWTQVIAPKDTRIAFYQARAEVTGSGNYTAGQLNEALARIEGLNIDHLSRCEAIAFHNITANYRRRIDNKNSLVMKQATALQTRAERYLGYTPTLEALKAIGEAEFESVTQEIARFEQAQLPESGFDTLDSLHANPARHTVDTDRIEEYYTAQIAALDGLFAGKLYDYDLPDASVFVRSGQHRFAAPASYSRRDDSMVVYAGLSPHDLNRAAFITVHEIIPGHHLDAKGERGAPICPENGTVPDGWLSEGWATYAEFLSDDAGYFDDPGHRLAWLDYRLIRAMRIIAAVQRYEFGPEREPLWALWQARMPKRLHDNFQAEYKRLTTSNDQHLSYIIGHQAIEDVKREFQSELGRRFNERAFHDALLRMTHREPAALYDTVLIAMDIAKDAAASEIK